MPIAVARVDGLGRLALVPQRSAPTPPRDTRADLGKQARLWALSLVCAVAGAGTVYATGSLLRGIGVFLIALVVLGPILFAIERRLTRRRLAEQEKTRQSQPRQRNHQSRQGRPGDRRGNGGRQPSDRGQA